MCPILDGYRVMTVFSFPYTPSCEPRLSSGGSLFLASYRQSVLVISTAKACGERRGGLVCPVTASAPATGVQNSSHLGAFVTFTMPFTFSFEEYADMIYVYGFCDGNSVLVVPEHQKRFPNRRIPKRKVFIGVSQALRDTGRLPGVRITAERGVNEGVNEDGIVRMVHRSPRTNTRRIARRLCVPHTRVWYTTAWRGHVSIPRAASVTFPTWRFCWEAELLQVAQWLSPVASLHQVYRRSAI